jgi:hypothetical protein
MSKKTIIGNIVLLFVSLLITALLAEGVFRYLHLSDEGKSSQFRIPHPVYGWALEPGVSYVNPLPEGAVPVSYNSRGWRDIEHTLENPDGTPRILILGDSYMEAYSVSLEDALPFRLQQLSLKNGNESEVINLGVGGYGTLQEYLVFRDHGKHYQPDTVLLGFYPANDVRNNSQTLESLITTNNIKTTSRPFLEPGDTPDWHLTTIDHAGALTRFHAERTKRDNLREASGGSYLLLEILKLFADNSEHSSEADSPDSKSADGGNRHMAQYGTGYCEEPAEIRTAWDITRRILKRLDTEAKAAGSKLLVFSVPAIHDVDTHRMNKIINNSPDIDLLCLEEAPGYARLGEILEELHIEYINLLPAFRQQTQDSNKSLFRESDRHWNEAGHQLAAEKIFSALQKNTAPHPGSAE